MVIPDEAPIMSTTTTNETLPGPAATDPRWRQMLDRDKTADGRFWYYVASTGVYCRPSCPARRPNPGNIGFHDTVADAKAAGFRACRRCNPDGLSLDAVNALIVAKACRLTEQSEFLPSLASLAESVELSPSHFHRLFKGSTGLTPRAYAAGRRAERVRQQLAKDSSVIEAIYEAGFGSSGRFYERSPSMLGMTPTTYKSGGAGQEIRFAVGQSSLGAILVASSAKGVVSILIGDDPNDLAEALQDRFPKARLVGGDAEYEALVARVVGLVEAPSLGLDLPLDIRGTVFQQRVWQALAQIPAGRVVSYSELAERIGSPKAVRAVAGACAANVIAIAIPCHRVVRNDGALSGYAWGVERKRALIAREAVTA